ncbi:MAG: hypothetical protein RBT11_19880 [Desulfobacterales bacterium]|jgi:ATP-dependent exoDNAse (exonuclease V) beta subunit|nr:hypothetical protein [Desulfobacterales bacterium]
MIKTAKHPSGRTIVFDDESHTYMVTETGQSLTSVTTFIGGFFPKFDAPSVAKRTAKKRGVDPDALLAEWNANGERARREGTNVHAYAEGLFNGELVMPAAPSERENKLFHQAALAVVKLLKRFEFAGAEVIVASPELGLAGMIDLLMIDRGSNEVIVLDWKQNAKIKDENFYQNALKPIEYLQAHDMNKYSLQLSLYEHILASEGYFKRCGGYRKALIHLTENQNRPIKIGNFQKEIDKMIAPRIAGY